MWLTVRSQRTEPTGTPEVRFIETPERAPHAIRSWYYPQRRMGHEFIYSKQEAMQLAKSSGEPVLMTESTAKDPESMQKATVQTVSPSGEITPFNRTSSDDSTTDAARNQQAPAVTQSARAERTTEPAVTQSARAERTNGSVGTAGQAPARPAPTRRRSLPQTASNLPLVAAIALASLMGGVTLRALAASRR